MFSATEALALVMAVLDGHHDVSNPTDAVGIALSKIVRVLPESVAAQVDWVAKLRVLEGLRERHNLSWRDAKLRAFDLQYHDMRAGRSLADRVGLERITNDVEVERAMTEPDRVANGQVVTLRYRLTGEDGKLLDDSGDEVTALQLPFDTNLCSSTMTALLAILGGSSSGTATFRAYIGGAQNTLGAAYTGGGTLVGSVTTTSALSLLRITGTPIANPGGVVLLTVTYESSAGGESVTKAGLTGIVQ